MVWNRIRPYHRIVGSRLPQGVRLAAAHASRPCGRFAASGSTKTLRRMPSMLSSRPQKISSCNFSPSRWTFVAYAADGGLRRCSGSCCAEWEGDTRTGPPVVTRDGLDRLRQAGPTRASARMPWTFESSGARCEQAACPAMTSRTAPASRRRCVLAGVERRFTRRRRTRRASRAGPDDGGDPEPPAAAATDAIGGRS